MNTAYLPLSSDSANTTYLPVDSERLVGVVLLNSPDRSGEGFLVVPTDGQDDVSLRRQTFDLVGPLDFHSRALTTFLEDRLTSMPEGQVALDGRPSQSTRGWGIPERAARIVGGKFPGTYFHTHCLVYPLAEPHETFGPEVQIYLLEDGGRQVGTLIGS